MKLLASISLFFALSCSALAAPVNSASIRCTEADLKDAKRVITQLYAHISQGDIPAFQASLSSNVTWVYHAPSDLVPWGGSYQSPNGIMSLFGIVLKYVPGGLSFQIQDMVAQCDAKNGTVVVAARSIESGKARTSTSGQEIDRDFHVNIASFFVVRDKLVEAIETYPDSASFYIAIR